MDCEGNGVRLLSMRHARTSEGEDGGEGGSMAIESTVREVGDGAERV